MSSEKGTNTNRGRKRSKKSRKYGRQNDLPENKRYEDKQGINGRRNGMS